MMRTELYLNGKLVDLIEDISTPLNYAIADIRNPKQRNGSYSKTIKLPATKPINILLTAIYDIANDIQTSGVVNFMPDFNPNLKAEAILNIDSLTQFRGYMRLLQINYDQQSFVRTGYEVALIGELQNIYTVIGDSKMTDLSLSEFNHTYDRVTQKATWTSMGYGSGYVYPMINYGGVTANSWDVTNFFPAVYFKTYIDKIFAFAGFSYTSAFFNSAFFKRLILPFCGDKFTISSAQVAQRLFASDLAADIIDTIGIASSATQLRDPVIFNHESLDPSNQYDPATGIFTAANAGYYDFYCTGVCSGVTNGAVTVGGLNTLNISSYFSITVAAITTTYPITINAPSVIPGIYGSNITLWSQTIAATSQTFFMNVGDTANIKIIQTMVNGGLGNIDFKINSGSVFINRITNTTIVAGNTLDMNIGLPIDIKQSDFLSSVLTMWNLYVEPDSNNPNNLIIETDADFYGSGKTWNWTTGKKVDSSRMATVIPMGDLDARRYRFKYADDADYWNKFYSDKWKETYGEKNIDITNDFLKNTNTNEVIFGATPIIGSTSHDRIIPEIFAVSSTGVQTPMRSKPRVLYWAGAIATTYSWSYTEYNSVTTTESTYPYAGHLDNPYSPTIDLCFGVPREIFYANPYGATIYTTDNTYNRYHSKFISEITDRNSKIVILYAYLKPYDIAVLSFRDRIFIDGHYFRMQKIMDYDPTQYQTTKVELLKVKENAPFTPVIHTIDFTANQMIDIGNRSPRLGGNVGNGDQMGMSLNLVTGDAGNYISQTSRGSSISGGRGNYIGDDTDSVNIISSSSVVVLKGVSNVTIINTNGITISESNVVYVNSIKM